MSEEKVNLSNLIEEQYKGLLMLMKAFCVGLEVDNLSDLEWQQALQKAKGHSVSSFVAEVANKSANVSDMVRNELITECKRTVNSNYRFYHMGKSITDYLEDNGIKTVILKGMATSSMYPIPELRKSGDIDLLLVEQTQLDEAAKLLEDKGFVKTEEQHANHHVVMEIDNISVELHSSMSEDFDDSLVNKYQKDILEKINENIVVLDCAGYKVPALKDAYHAYNLIIHMLQHYLREGVGLRLLCDWYMFWNRDIAIDQKESYMKMISDSRIKGFSDMITLVTVDFLGLDKSKVEFMNLPKEFDSISYMEDMLKGGEFGILDSDRMVALRDSNIFEYIRVFHHQMHLNFPKAGKVFIIWPILWTATLIIFIRNNKKVRNNSGMAYIKKAKERSVLIKNLNLFK